LLLTMLLPCSCWWPSFYFHFSATAVLFDGIPNCCCRACSKAAFF
jgi:hypothetical protein